jgi:hypothetical protein
MISLNLLRVLSFGLWIFLTPSVCLSALADSRDEEIFGADAAKTEPSTNSASNKEPTAIADQFESSYGGRLEIEATSSHLKGNEVENDLLSHRATADVYYEAKPNKDFRGIFRLRFVDQPQNFSAGNINIADPTQSLQIDEALLRWDVDRALFVTAGKQHLKWGAARFWNPTDFLANAVRDPLASFDRRLGVYLLKCIFRRKSWASITTSF